jgi:hypothetical protein
MRPGIHLCYWKPLLPSQLSSNLACCCPSRCRPVTWTTYQYNRAGRRPRKEINRIEIETHTRTPQTIDKVHCACAGGWGAARPAAAWARWRASCCPCTQCPLPNWNGRRPGACTYACSFIGSVVELAGLLWLHGY